MFYVSNICCLCLKTSCDLYKNVRDYDGNVTLQEKLSLLPALRLEDNDYKLFPDCHIIIKNMYDFTTNSVRCLNIFQNYLKQLKSSKNSCMFQLSLKLRDIGEDVDSLNLCNEDRTNSTEDVEDSNNTKAGMCIPNDDVTTSLCCNLQTFEHYEKEHHSVKTEIEDEQLEDSEYNIIEAANTEQQHFADQEIKIEIEDADLQMECLSNESDNLQLEAPPCFDPYQELKMEIEETNIKKECFPDENEPECLASDSDNQGTSICDYCKRAFTTSKYCQKHIRRCRDRVYNQPSTSATSIPDKKPRLTIDGENLYQCDKCDKKYQSQNGLYVHLRRHRRAGHRRLHTCRECHKQFITSSHLAQHLLIHTGEKPHKCAQCEAEFNRASSLKRHLLTHSGARPHKCTQCGQSFTQSCHLTTHMRTHKGERRYQCTRCNKAFIQSIHLTIHMRTHTGERPYKCTQCNKACITPSDLISHMRTHTGEKPYECTVCNQAFAHSNSLKYHMKKHSK